MQTDTIVNLLDYDNRSLARYCEEIGERSYRATQIIKWIHQLGVTDFDVMTNLSKTLRKRLAGCAEIKPPKIHSESLSRDGTRKWLMAVGNNNAIETVFIPENERGTLCISAQVGCPLNCRFCATARQGFNRNLLVSEIIGQVWLASRQLGHSPKLKRQITNVVLMGMGEPLLNVDNVIAAIEIMLDDNAYNFGRKRVTLSTAGLVPGIDKLSTACPVSLAVSLHAPHDELRDLLVPINRSYPLAELMAACRRYTTANPKHEITFEYVMLKNVNDGIAEARAVVRLLRQLPAKVNLIPFNPFPNSGFECSEANTIDTFRDELVSAGILTFTRKTRGADIAAACGQLTGEVQAKAHRLSNSMH